MTILQRLNNLADSDYADFQAKLTPTLPREVFIGVRVPKLRALAKEIMREGGADDFYASLPHKYYDENLLHSILISLEKDYDKVLRLLPPFLPYVDNWAVCDLLSPKCFAKHHDELIELIPAWIDSPHTYTSRFGMGVLMGHYLDSDFKPEYLELPLRATSDEYYVRMMVAWYYATALAKQWDATVPYIEDRKLCEWTHRKTIQKACESYRITDEQKNYLRALK